MVWGGSKGVHEGFCRGGGVGLEGWGVYRGVYGEVVYGAW